LDAPLIQAFITLIPKNFVLKPARGIKKAYPPPVGEIKKFK
jgi:hypothetical protein